jgi:L-fuculose-phosphate aldolase
MVEQDSLQQEREAISELGIQMLEQGLTTGTGGNISASDENGNMAISPTGMAYPEITATDVPVLGPEDDIVFGDRDPSSEHRMHRMLHEDHEEVSGVVHTHSPYASAFASAGEPIPASHYLVAFAGRQVPIADYATYGTAELGNLAAETIGAEYNACLLQNHGVIAVGESPNAAFEIALMVEYCAKNHYIASHIGDPIILSDEEIDQVQEKFADYGQNQ